MNLFEKNGLWHALIYPILGYFRRRRGQLFLAQFPDLRNMSVCDLGGSEHFWDKLDIGMPEEKLTIFNIGDADDTSPVPGRESRHRIIPYDGRRVPAKDNAFDLCISNSVVEHVPPEQRRDFAREILRLAPRILVQTPAFEFPFEPHFLMPFLHWLPRSLSSRLVWISPWRLLSRPPASTVRNYFGGTQLLSEAEMTELFPGCRIISERFCGLVKSHYVVRGVD
jgi:hypothetical protein